MFVWWCSRLLRWYVEKLVILRHRNAGFGLQWNLGGFSSCACEGGPDGSTVIAVEAEFSSIELDTGAGVAADVVATCASMSDVLCTAYLCSYMH